MLSARIPEPYHNVVERIGISPGFFCLRTFHLQFNVINRIASNRRVVQSNY